MPASPRQITIAELLERFDSVLLDSFGVLVDGRGALPGAAALVRALSGRDYQVVTNDASRLPSTSSDRYRDYGLDIPAARILTSGMLIEPHFRDRNLEGAPTLVLGTDDSREYARRAGADVAGIDPDTDYRVIIAADDDGYPYFEGVDAALSSALRQCERGEPPELILPNPDVIYPKARGHFGFTAGAVALVLEAGLERRLGERAPRFARLGKPNSPIFTRALERASSDPVMIGDQLETDIAGAARCGIATALLTTGVTKLRGDEEVVPDYVLEELRF